MTTTTEVTQQTVTRKTLLIEVPRPDGTRRKIHFTVSPEYESSPNGLWYIRPNIERSVGSAFEDIPEECVQGVYARGQSAATERAKRYAEVLAAAMDELQERDRAEQRYIAARGGLRNWVRQHREKRG